MPFEELQKESDGTSPGQDREYLARAPGALSTTDLAEAIESLRIYELKRKAESQDKAESLSAKRLLNTILGQTTRSHELIFFLRAFVRMRPRLPRAL